MEARVGKGAASHSKEWGKGRHLTSTSSSRFSSVRHSYISSLALKSRGVLSSSSAQLGYNIRLALNIAWAPRTSRLSIAWGADALRSGGNSARCPPRGATQHPCEICRRGVGVGYYISYLIAHSTAHPTANPNAHPTAHPTVHPSALPPRKGLFSFLFGVFDGNRLVEDDRLQAYPVVNFINNQQLPRPCPRPRPRSLVQLGNSQKNVARSVRT